MVTMFVNIECNNVGELSCPVITLYVKFSKQIFLIFHLLKGGMRRRKKYIFITKSSYFFCLILLNSMYNKTRMRLE